MGGETLGRRRRKMGKIERKRERKRNRKIKREGETEADRGMRE